MKKGGLEDPCSETCVGARCQVTGPHTLHTAVVPYLDEKFRRRGYVRLEWPIDDPDKPKKGLKTWEKL